MSVDTSHDQARNTLGQHKIFKERGEVIAYSRGVQFEIFQADCLSFDPSHLEIESIRARKTDGTWVTVKSGTLVFWHYGIGSETADCNTALNPNYDSRFGAYAANGRLHMVIGHDGDQNFQRCGPISW